MGRFTDDGWESGRDEFSEEQCAWCGDTFTACWARTTSNLARPLCANCLDHLCTQCGDARAVGLDHTFAPMQMCQGCSDSAFEEASQALSEPVVMPMIQSGAGRGGAKSCLHCGDPYHMHLGPFFICPASVYRSS